MKYCDLVMKGGITSGLVYPNAVLRLAEGYRFKNIGGTSAGAIAAGLTAAAALGDRRLQAEQEFDRAAGVGFDGLAGIAEKLGTEGFIYSLFQPVAGARSAFRLLVAATGPGTPASKMMAAVLAVAMTAPLPFLLSLALLELIAFLVAGRAGVTGAAVPAVLCAFAVAGILAGRKVSVVMRRNMLGICNGMPSTALFRRKHLALTEWLHSELQALSGKPSGEPLTFDDLWEAPRYADEPASERALDLKMIATDVSHHEPRSIPFEKAQFWFRLDEFDELFPEEVVGWLVKKGGAPRQYGGDTYYRLPSDGGLPVLVGMRMSLSFPLLLSAVPLHEPERTRTESELSAPTEKLEDTLLSSAEALTTGGTKTEPEALVFRPCWFSDGGISSNFPIHLFDAALPRWPTFAINLVPTNPGSPRGEVFLPTENNQGWQRNYHSLKQASAGGELVGFVLAIVATMQNWRDLLQARAPGHRDRIAHVSLPTEEGGLNLNMPQEVLDSISDKGTRAGAVFATFSFENHYWVRWRNVAAGLQRFTEEAAVNAKSSIAGYEIGHAMASTGSPAPPSYKFDSQRQQEAAQELLEEIEAKAAAMATTADLTRGAPRPLPQLRMTPTY